MLPKQPGKPTRSHGRKGAWKRHYLEVPQTCFITQEGDGWYVIETVGLQAESNLTEASDMLPWLGRADCLTTRVHLFIPTWIILIYVSFTWLWCQALLSVHARGWGVWICILKGEEPLARDKEGVITCPEVTRFHAHWWCFDTRWTQHSRTLHGLKTKQRFWSYLTTWRLWNIKSDPPSPSI